MNSNQSVLQDNDKEWERKYPFWSRFVEAGVEISYKSLVDQGTPVPDFSLYPQLLELWIRGFKDLPKISVDMMTTLSENPSLVAEDWTRGPFTWETTMMTTSEATALRCDFKTQCLLKGVTAGWSLSAERRWEKGQFTCVTTNMVVIGDVWCTLPHPMTIASSREDFLARPGTFDEVECSNGFSHLGRTSLTPALARKLKWGSGINDIIAVRLKINGERFVKIRVGEETILRGWKDIKVPADFPVEVAEEYGGEFWVVFPYALQEFTHNGIKYRAHPWQSVTEISIPKARHHCDGVMLLTQTCEYRVKFFPSLEFLNPPGRSGVWECIWGFPWKSYSPRLIGIRPRPGKPYSTNIDKIHQEISWLAYSKLLPPTSFSTRVIESGVFETSFSFRRKDDATLLYLDSGYRFCQVKGYPVLASQVIVPVARIPSSTLEYVRTGDHHIEYVADSTPVKYPFPVKSKGQSEMIFMEGAKIFLFSPAIKKFLLIKDDSQDKVRPWDLPGGKLEGKETPVVALLRELKEELDITMTLDQVSYLGYTDDTEMKKGIKMYYRSHVFLGAFHGTCPENCRFLSLAELLSLRDLDYQPWLPRHVKYLEDAISGNLCNLQIILGPGGIVSTPAADALLDGVNPLDKSCILSIVTYLGGCRGFVSNYYVLVDWMKINLPICTPQRITSYSKWLKNGKGSIALSSMGKSLLQALEGSSVQTL